jgi:hypothetical protein
MLIVGDVFLFKGAAAQNKCNDKNAVRFHKNGFCKNNSNARIF